MESKVRSLFTIYFYVLLFGLILILPNVMQTAEAGYIVAQVEMDTYPTAPMANVAPGQSGTVVFSGKVVLTKYPPKREQVFLNLRANTNKPQDTWGASVFPPVVVINPLQTSADIQVFVTAPMYENVNEFRNVNITGTWMLNPGPLSGEITTGGVFVRVAPYIKYVVFPVEGYQRVWPGGEASYKLGILNLGNREESFHISITNLDSLSDADFAIHFTTETLTVKPFEQGVFDFKVFGTVKYFHPWRSHMTTISIHVEPVQDLPDLKGMSVGIEYAQNFDFFYYEFGPSFPEPCIAGIIIGIVALVGLYYYLKKRSRKRRIIRKLLRRKKRQERRRQQED